MKNQSINQIVNIQSGENRVVGFRKKFINIFSLFFFSMSVLLNSACTMSETNSMMKGNTGSNKEDKDGKKPDVAKIYRKNLFTLEELLGGAYFIAEQQIGVENYFMHGGKEEIRMDDMFNKSRMRLQPLFGGYNSSKGEKNLLVEKESEEKESEESEEEESESDSCKERSLFNKRSLFNAFFNRERLSLEMIFNKVVGREDLNQIMTFNKNISQAHDFVQDLVEEEEEVKEAINMDSNAEDELIGNRDRCKIFKNTPSDFKIDYTILIRNVLNINVNDRLSEDRLIVKLMTSKGEIKSSEEYKNYIKKLKKEYYLIKKEYDLMKKEAAKSFGSTFKNSEDFKN